MIRKFIMSDVEHFVPNEYSCADKLDFLTNPEFHVQSVIDDRIGSVHAIIVFRNYWGRCWSSFILVSRDFPASAAREVRTYLHANMKALNAQRLQTESVSIECLRRWHRFMGFKLEGTKEKMIFDRDYDMWALLREEV